MWMGLEGQDDRKISDFKNWLVFGKYKTQYYEHLGISEHTIILKNPKTSKTVHWNVQKNEWKLYKKGDIV